MGIRLTVLSVATEPPPSLALKGRKLSLGRSETNHLRLPDPTVSPLHATLRQRGQSFLLQDEGSTNGTAIASAGDSAVPVWLGEESPRVVTSGDHILLGRIELLVELVEDELVRDELEAEKAEGLRIEKAARAANFAAALVESGLQAAGAPHDRDHVLVALEELTAIGDEELVQGPEDTASAAPKAQPAPSVVERWGKFWDLLVGLVALLFLTGALFGLFWLLR